jgi:hypothetical protein
MGNAESARPGSLRRSEEGLDLTLIRWVLSLTPAERLEVLPSIVDLVEMVRRNNG